ncbi:D-alanyl-D-alanine carboxypeptidase / D-alanyl-D-alanine-endopeptidase (penicillin-binding protein 4) [Nitrosomonas sp. Nm34]|nr:D-alanyl-D-alanine carboxypeptidase / D-alanyl-D-alanine-endopeptidase (penicillin-binding protein 4) [Nitrosomonas sp. Nm34]
MKPFLSLKPKSSAMLSFLLAITILCALPAWSADMPQAVRQALKQARIPEAAVGIYVKEVSSQQPVIAVNSGTALNPASVMKLVTTYAGLELLGPAYSWRTEIYALGKIEDGVLRGDLALKGYGDPHLNLENFWLLVRQIRQAGIKEITGDLLLDNSYYNVTVGDPGAFDGDRYKTYNIFPEALLVNYRTSALHLMPQVENNTVRVVADPASELLDLQNNLKLTRGNCGDWSNQLRVEVRERQNGNGRTTVILNGNYAMQCGHNTYYLSLHENPDYIHDLFKKLWLQQGGSFSGAVRNSVVPKGIVPLRVYHSPPLAQIIRGINKFSNNVAARQLYLALGDTTIPPNGHTSVSLAQSDQIIRRWLLTKRLSSPELILENGSGLSRTERISASQMGELLVAAFHSPVMPEFISSLPIAGVDGTMKSRFKGTLVAGRAHMKTGTLNEVATIAGYLLDHKNRRNVVVFFVNHAQATNARSAMDALIRWVYERA